MSVRTHQVACLTHHACLTIGATLQRVFFLLALTFQGLPLSRCDLNRPEPARHIRNYLPLRALSDVRMDFWRQWLSQFASAVHFMKSLAAIFTGDRATHMSQQQYLTHIVP
jgi:hypothetical protein